MENIKLECTIRVSEEEMEDWLVMNGYRLEKHKCLTYGQFRNIKSELKLALSDKNSDIISQNEYRKVFERMINETFQHRMKDFILHM